MAPPKSRQFKLERVLSSASPLKRPIHLILDWDGTLTTRDTLEQLGKLPRAKDARLQAASPDSSVAPNSTKTTWADLVEAYMIDYRKHEAIHVTKSSNPQDLIHKLRSLQSVEYASVKRTQDAKFFHMVTTEDVVTVIRNALESGDLQLRSGWDALFQLFLPSGPHLPTWRTSKISIVSVNWSETFIRWSLFLACKRLSCLDDTQKQRLGDMINDMRIHANEIHGLNSPQGSSGRLIGNLRTSMDKLRAMEGIVASSETSLDDKPIVAYVGDSSTDYECLCAADIGVWISDVPESEVGANFEKVFRPLTQETMDFGWAPDLATVAQDLRALSQEDV